jgi:hypothetical protein
VSIANSTPTEYLSPDQIVAVLNVCTNTVTRLFEGLEGVIDLGSPETLHKRRKRCLRIPRPVLERFITSKQVKVRR